VATPGLTEIVWVSGPDAIGFLDGLLSQNIAAIDVGATAPSLLLAPNGKLRATLLVLRGTERVGLVCDAGCGQSVASDLARFKIRVDVLISLEPEQIWDVWGSGAAVAVGGVPAVGEWSADGPVRFRRPFRHTSLDRVVVVGSPPGVVEVPARALEATRIEIGEPIMGVDLTDKTIPQEGVDVGAAVDFTKGCYLGQELVARIDSRGHVNRRLAGVIFDDAVAAGTEIHHNGKAVGSVTSVAWSEQRSSHLGLAMLRVEIEPGTIVEAGHASGRACALPMTW
jgi:folate-binding protein YgfZ